MFRLKIRYEREVWNADISGRKRTEILGLTAQDSTNKKHICDTIFRLKTEYKEDATLPHPQQ